MPEAVKQEIKKNIRAIVILVISLLLIYFNVSVVNFFHLTIDSKIKWALDIGIYNSLLNIIFSLFDYWLNGRKLKIKVEILNKNENINELTIRDENPRDIVVKINVQGKTKKKKLKFLVISFPHWIDFQNKPKSYLDTNEVENICSIDLNKIITQQGNVQLTESITFSLLSNSDDHNEALIEAQLKHGKFDKIFKLHFENQGIKVRRR
jgi:hypothetical protein